MRLNLNLCMAVIAVFCIISCSKKDIILNEHSEPDQPTGSANLPSTEFTGGKWWNFVPRSVEATQHHTLYTTDATLGWILRTPNAALDFWPNPSWIKTIYFRDTLYLFYFRHSFSSTVATGFYLNRSVDGINWQSAQLIHGLWTRDRPESGLAAIPEIAVIDNNIYAFGLDPLAGQLSLTVKKLNGFTFDLFSQQPITNTYPDYNTLSPSYAKLNGRHYLFFRNGPGGTDLQVNSSTDLVNWTPATALCTNCGAHGDATDATALGNYMYVSLRKADNSMLVVKTTGAALVDMYTVKLNGTTIVKTRSINIPIESDDSKLVISYRGNGDNDKNYIAYSYTGGQSWSQVAQPSSSAYNRTRELIYTPY